VGRYGGGVLGGMMRISTTGLLFDDPARSTPGYVLIRPSEGDRTILLDPDGQVAHEWQTGGGVTNWAYLLPNMLTKDWIRKFYIPLIRNVILAKDLG